MASIKCKKPLDPDRNSRISFASDKNLWAIVWRCLRDSKFNGFDTIPACDRRTDGRTHDDSIYRASITSRGKNRFMSLTCFDAGLRQSLVGPVQSAVVFGTDETLSDGGAARIL